MRYTEYNEDSGRNEFASHLEGESSKYSALQSLISGKMLEQEEIESLREFKVFNQYLESPVGSSSEAKLKEVFATAVIIANEKEALPFSLGDKSPVAIASAIDEGLNRVKYAYKISTEELDAVEVADRLIDATVARVATVADKVIERGVPVVLDKVCTLVAKVYPPAALFSPYIKAAEKIVVPAAKVVVRKGLAIVANTAKTVVRSAVKGLKKVARRLRSIVGL